MNIELTEEERNRVVSALAVATAAQIRAAKKFRDEGKPAIADAIASDAQLSETLRQRFIVTQPKK